MKRAAILGALLLLCGWAGNAVARGAGAAPAAAQEKIAQTTLKAGDVAPDFTLPDNNSGTVKLSDYRGKKNVILAFYVLAFTGG